MCTVVKSPFAIGPSLSILDRSISTHSNHAFSLGQLADEPSFEGLPREEQIAFVAVRSSRGSNTSRLRTMTMIPI